MLLPRLRDGRLLAVLIAIMSLLAWWALWTSHSVLHSAHAAHVGVIPFVIGWTVMTLAMMLPASIPLILLFQKMVSGQSDGGRLIALLVSGYLAVWAAVGLLAHYVQLALGSVSWLAAHEWAMRAFILLIAGLYQFSPLKYACLDKCRSPMLFLMETWSSSKRRASDALRVGAAHGMYCVGCCWSLMLVMLAMSAGSMAWMLGLGIVMAMEKNLPWGRRLSAPVGVTLVLVAIAVAAI